MYTISKLFHFSASHQLKGLRPGHPCMRLHGHNYTVKIVLACQDVDAHGFVMDYGELSPFGDYIMEKFDHQHLNDALPGIHPTAENLAKYLYDIAWAMFADVRITICISETEKTWAFYEGA